jgi:hypothetical protein
MSLSGGSIWPGALGLPGAAAFFQSGVERVEGGCMRHRREEIRAGILHQSFDLAFAESSTSLQEATGATLPGLSTADDSQRRAAAYKP